MKPISSPALVRGLLLFTNYLNIFSFCLFGPLYVLYVRDLGATAFDISLTTTIYSGTLGLALIILGRWEDHLHRFPQVIFFGYAMLSVSALGYLLMSELWQVYVVQIWNALGTALFMPAWKVLYAQIEDRGHEASQWSIVDGGNQLLAGISALLGGIIVSLLGYPSLFIFMSLVQLVGAIISYRLIRMVPRP